MPRASQPWRDLGVRFVSGAVLAPAGLACIWAGGWVWVAVLSAIAAGLGLEWAALCGVRPWSAPAAAVPLALLFAGLACLVLPFGEAFGMLLAASAATMIVTGRRDLGLGTLYIGIAYQSLLVLRRGTAGFGDVLFVMLVVWAGDIGAYLAGRLVGGPRLAPALSPGKTWSGALGGLVCSVLTGIAVRAWLTGTPQPGAAVPLALLLGTAAQAGDLLESAIKRYYGRKDSGSLIPGHGGLLDRLDGLIGAAPVAAACAALTHQGLAPWHP